MNNSGWWRKVLNMISGEKGRWFWENVSRELGDGRETNFWTDVWIGENSLISKFPRLYHLSLNRSAWVSEMGRWDQNE